MRKSFRRLGSLLRATAAVWKAERARLRGARFVARRHSGFERLEQRQLLATTAHQLIHLDTFRADPRFSGINGTGTSIVVIDDAFDLNHTDFKDGGGVSRIQYSYDYADNDANAHDVRRSHGTHVASIAAGLQHGIAPGAKLILFKGDKDANIVADPNGGGIYPSATEGALQWVITNGQTGGYNVVAVNMSFGGAVSAVVNDNAGNVYDNELTTLGSANQVLLVAAAGNEYRSKNNLGFAAAGVNDPAFHSKVRAVGNTYSRWIGDYNTTLNSTDPVHSVIIPYIFPGMYNTSSNRSPTLTDIVAGGTSITAAVPNTDSAKPNPDGVKSGTSMSSPAVAGVVALMQQLAIARLGGELQANSANPRDILALLTSTATEMEDGSFGMTYSIPSQSIANQPFPGNGGTYRLLDVQRAGEQIIEWQLSDATLAPASTAWVEFNHEGRSVQSIPLATANQTRRFMLKVDAAGAYKIELGNAASGTTVPPAVLIRPQGSTNEILARAPGKAMSVEVTLNPGIYEVDLVTQHTPATATTAEVTIVAPRPAVQSWTSLADGSATGSVNASGALFGWRPGASSATLSVALTSGSFAPVVSVFDSVTGQQVARNVGTAAAGVSLPLTGLQVDRFYSVRVGANNLAGSGNFNLNVSYSPPVAAAQLDVLNATLTQNEVSAVREGLLAVHQLGRRLLDTDAFKKQLSFTDADLAKMSFWDAELFSEDDFNGFVKPLTSLLPTGSTMLMSNLLTVLQSFTHDGFGAVSMLPGSVGARRVQSGGSSYIELSMVLQSRNDGSVDLKNNGTAGAEKFTFGDQTRVAFTAGTYLDLALRINLDAAPAPAEKVTVDLRRMRVFSKIDDSNISAVVTNGLAEGTVTKGSLKLDADISINNAVAGGSTAAFVTGSQVADVVTVTPTGSLQASFPVAVNIGQFAKNDASLNANDSNLFDDVLSTVSKVNWGDLDRFVDVTAAELLTLIRGLQAKVLAIRNLPAINTTIPFTQGVTLGELLKIDELLGGIDKALSTAEAGAAFLTSVDLLERVNQILDLEPISQNYNPATQELSFSIDFSKRIDQTLPFRLGIDTSVLDFTATADLSIKASVDFKLTFGIDLTPPGGGVTLAERFFLDDGRLKADLALNLTNVGGSAKLFDFLGVNLSGGSGTVSASLGVDFFGGARVTLADIGRSIANSGTAVSGKNPVPAALSNLNYTGTGDITLPNIALSGLSFTPTGAPQLKLHLPDFKTPSILNVGTSQLGELLSFQNLGFDDLLSAIRTFVNNLKNNAVSSFLNKDIPGTGKSIGDLINFIDRIATAVEQLQDGDAGTLQEAAAKIESKLESALGINPNLLTNVLSIVRDASTNKPAITMQLNSNDTIGGSFGFDLDVDDLLGSGSLAGFPSIASSLIDASASGTVTYSGGFNLNLGFGVYLDTPTSPVAFVKDTSSLQLTAFASANNTLDAELGIGPLAIFVDNGTLKLSEQVGNNNPARFAVGLPPSPATGGRISIAQLPALFTNLNSRITMNAAVNVALPMFGPTISQPLVGVNGGNNVFTAQINNLGTFFGNGTGASLYSPDIQSVLSGFSFTGGIGSLLTGLDMLLGQLADLAQGELFGLDLPFVGTSLKNSAPSKLLETLRLRVQQAASTPQSLVTAVRTELQNALIAAGFTGSPVVSYTAYDASGNVQGTSANNFVPNSSTADIRFRVAGTGTANATPSIDFDLGIPGFSLDLKNNVNNGDANLRIDADWTLDLGFGINTTDGFYLETSAANEIRANAFVTVPAGTTLGGELGFLRLSATNDTSGGNTNFLGRNLAGTFFAGGFNLNLKSPAAGNKITYAQLTSGDIFNGSQDVFDYLLTAKAKLDLDLSLETSFQNISSAALPKLLADLKMLWDFTQSDSSPQPNQNHSSLSFDNVRMDLGAFLQRQAGPVITRLYNALEPLRPAITVFNTALPVVNDLAPLRNYVDGQGNQDGKATLRDLAQGFSSIPTPALKFLDAAAQIDSLYSLLSGFTTSSAPTINLGSYNVNIVGGVASLAQSSAPANIDTQLAGVTGAVGTNARALRSAQSAWAGFGEGGLSFPLLSNPASAVNLLIGKDVSLVQIDFPKLEFGFTFDFSFPIFPAVTVDVSAGMSGFADFGVGYDTRGLRQFKDSGYSDFSKIANGFYLRDKKDIGGMLVDVPEMGIRGSVDLYASLNAVIVKLSVGGGVSGEIFADLHDPNDDGRVNLDELSSLFPYKMFDKYGKVTAGLQAKASIGVWPFKKTYTKKIAEVTLIDFNSYDGPAPATLSGGTLTLNTTGEDDTFILRRVGGTATTDDILVMGNGATQQYNGVQRIVFHGGAGNDRITFVTEEKDTNGDGVIDERIAITRPATLTGGAGDDKLIAGDGADSIDGGDGDDELAGNSGNDTINAGAGNDTVEAGNGNDSVLLGDGNDQADGGLGVDTIRGEAGNDILAGGGDADSLDGGAGDDELTGDEPSDSLVTIPIGNDTILGGDGNDEIEAGPGNDSLLGGNGNDTIAAGDGNDTVDGGAGFDRIAGNAGNDSLIGGADNDVLFGHSGQSSDSGTDDDRIFGNAGNDTVLAGLGNDCVEGGLGSDSIAGEAGNDTLIGGSASGLPVDDSSDSITGGAGVDLLFGDDASVGAAPGFIIALVGGSGADFLDAGDGDDRLFGQGGADQLTGGLGNDSIEAGLGADTVFAQAGHDTVFGADGDDQIQGFTGNDSLVGGNQNDQILGGAGLDSIFGDAGNDDLYGDADSDLIYGGSGNDTAQGGAGIDTIIGGGGFDQLYGYGRSDSLDDGTPDLIYGGYAVGHPLSVNDGGVDAADTIAGQGGNDTIFAEEGNDQISGGAGNDSIDAGAGNDLLRGDLGDDTLLAQAGDDVAHGGAGNDSIVLSTGNDRAFGDAGADTLLGDVGNDVIDGGADNDSILGGDDHDTLLGGAGVDRIFGELGNDQLEAGTGVGDLLDAGAGDDLIIGSIDGGDDANPADTIAFGDSILAGPGNDTVRSLGGADTIDAGEGDDSVDAGAHNDRILLGPGNDFVLAGSGNDSIEGGAGAETIYGEAGADTILGQDGGDLLDGGADADSILGGAGDDDLRAGTDSGNQLFGEAGADLLTGSNDGADLLEGGIGDDQINGMAGNDTIRGQDGADVVDAGAGDDTIEGGAGADILAGGADHDSIYGHSITGAGDDNAIDTLFGDFGTGTDDAGAGRDRLFGNGGFDVLFGEGNDDFINDFGSNDSIYFGAGDGATPNNFVAPNATPPPGALPAPTLPQRDGSLPSGALPIGRWAEFAGKSAGGMLGQSIDGASVAIDALNRRYVAWADTRNGNAEIYVARHDGTTWTQLAGSASFGGVSNSAANSVAPSITVDASNNPIVSWTEGNSIYVARFNGTAWVAIGNSLTGPGVSGTNAASSPKIVNAASGATVLWLDSSSGTTQVYARRFNGTTWVDASTGSASGGGVSQSATGVSELAATGNGTNVAFAWTQSVGSLTQVMLREYVGTSLVERSGSASGNGASNALYGALSPTLAYQGSTLHLAFVAPLDAALPINGILARRHDGAAWIDSNTIVSPAGGAIGQLSSPSLAAGGGEVRLAWIQQRTTADTLRTVDVAGFDDFAFVNAVPASAEGHLTTATSLSIVADSSGRIISVAAEPGGIRAVVENARITRVFTAGGATTVQSILDANDLGPGDAIVISGTVTGFTVGGDDAGVSILSDRTSPAIVSGAVTVSAADVQLQGVTFNAALTVTGANAVIRFVRTTVATNLRGANVSATGNAFNGTVNIDQASSGVIAGNTFTVVGGTGLNITAAFTGAVRGNTFSGSAIGLHVGAAATVGGNDFAGNTTGIRVAGVTLGGAGIEPNTVRSNGTGILLQSGATVLRQNVSGNTVGMSGTGTVGSTSPADANVFDNNTTGASISGVVQGNRFTRNGVAIVAGTMTRVHQNQVFDSTGDGIRATAARVVITHNTVIVAGRAVDAAGGASEVEVRNNILVTSSGHALYVDSAARTGFWSDNNLLFAEPGAHLVHWFVDFVDILDWQQDVARYDLRSEGTTAINPSATRPRFIGLDNLAAAKPIGNVRASSPAGDLGTSIVDVGVTRARTNLLTNPSFESGSTAGWTANGTGSVPTSATAWDGTRYYTTGASVNGFLEQTVNLLSAGFTTTQLDSQDLAAMFGARVAINGATKAIVTFLNGSNAAIGSPAEFAVSADSSRWELIGGRARLPNGTRAIRVRFEGAVANTLIDSSFLYVENDNLTPDAGFGGSSSTDAGTAIPRIALRSTDLYTDLILDKPTVIRWDTFGDTNERPVKIELLQDAAQGAQFLMTLAASTADTGSFEFRPLDFGLAAGTGGYRIRVSLVGDDIAFDRATEASKIPETGNDFYVDDASNANDEFTAAAVGSNRNTGKLATAPKPQLNSVLRIYDLGPTATVHVDTGSYNQFDRALISGVVGIGDDEGVIIEGPADPAKVAALNMTSPTTGFDIYDGDDVKLRRLTVKGPGIGLYVRNGSINFDAQRVTITSPTAQGVYLDATATGTTLDGIGVTGAGAEGIFSAVYLSQLTNATVTGSAQEGVQLDAGVGTISGGLFQNNLIGILNTQSAASGVANITGNRFVGNARNGYVEGSFGGPVNLAGNTFSGHTNATYPAVSVTSANSVVSGNVLIGNAVGIFANRVSVTGNRVENSTVVGIDAGDGAVAQNVVIGGPLGIRIRDPFTGVSSSVRNNLVYGVTSTGIELNTLGADGTVVENNTISMTGGTGISATGNASNIRLKNNIIVVSTGTAISIASTAQTGFASNYNLFQVTGSGAIGNWQGVARTALAAWRSATATDGNSFTGDPMFVNAGAGDFHEQSQTGSHKGGSLAPLLGGNGLPTAATITLSADANHSVAIDRGDPTSPFANEPAPRGNSVNLGAFGNTAQASQSLPTYVQITSPNGGEQWPIGQSFPINWISHNASSTVTIQLLKAGAPVLTIASGEANDGNYLWAVPNTLTPAGDYRIRITRADGGVDQSDGDFVIAPVTSIYYVNDASTTGDVFASAPGTALGDGLSPSTPNLSIKYVLDNYDLGPNDVIRVDSGTYLTTVDIVIAADDSGVTIEGPDWTGESTPRVTIDRGNASADTFVFGGANADNITLRNLGLTGGRNSVRLAANADNSFWTVERVRSFGNATNNDHFQINTTNNDFTLRNSVIVGGTASGNNGVYTNAARTIVEDTTFNDGYVGVEIAAGGASAIVRNNTFNSPRNYGVSINYEPTDPTNPILVQGNTIANTVPSNGGAGMFVRAYALVSDNTISGFNLNGGNATGIYSTSRLSTLRNNIISNNRYGIRSAGARSIGNVLTGNTVIGISAEFTTVGPNYILGNTVTGSPSGIYLGSHGQSAVVTNNVLRNNGIAVNVLLTPSVDFTRIHNNTIAQGGGRGVYLNGGARNISVRNNIYSMAGGTAFEAVAGSTTSVSTDYNLYDLSGGAIVGLWQGQTFATLPSWQNTLQMDADSLAANPLFVDAGAGNFTLQSGSPAIDGGDPNAAFLGETTQSGGRVDLGAYGNTPSANASAPQLVQVVNPNGSERFVVGTPRSVSVRGFGIAAQDVIVAIDVGGNAASWISETVDMAVHSAPWHAYTSTTSSINLAGAVNPAPAAVYQNWAFSSSASALEYSLPVADGNYTLRLHFIEPTFSTAGSRVMDISVNNVLAVDNFDIIGSGVANRQAKILELPASATGGTGIGLILRDVVGDALISGIEIVRANAGGVAAPTVNIDLTDNDLSYASFATNVALDRFGRATLPWAPAVPTTQGRFKVTSNNAPLSDVSDATFVVEPVTNTYYINDGVLNADDIYTTAIGDDGNNGLSPSSPMRSLSVLLALYDLNPGDTVYLDAGTYNLTDRVIITAADAGVMIRGVDMDKTILSRGLSTSEVIVLNNADGVTISDLAVTAGSYGINAYDGSDSDNLVIERVRAFGNNNGGIFINTTNDNAIVRESVAYGIPGGAGTDNQGTGIHVAGSGGQVLGNSAYNNGSTGILIDNGTTAAGNTVSGQTRGLTVGASSLAQGNTVSANTTGIDFTGAGTARGNTLTGNTTGFAVGIFTQALIEQNTITGGATGINAGYGTVRGNTISGTSATGIAFVHTTLTDNTVFNTPVGIRQTGGSLGFVVSGNLVYGTTTAGLSIEGGHSNAYDVLRYYNNTFIGSGDAVRITAGDQIVLRNNLLMTTGGAGYGINVSPTIQYNISSDYNLFHIASDKLVRWAGADYTDMVNVRGGLLIEKHSLVANPQFVDVAAANYAVLGTSPTIDAGDPSMAYGLEPAPNGGRANIGHLGNRAIANPSPTRTAQVASPDGGEKYEVGQSITIRYGSSDSNAGPSTVLDHRSAALARTPAGYWTLDETSGTLAADLTGNGRGGTYSGAVSLNDSGAWSNSAAPNFNGGAISVPHHASLSTPSITVGGWVNPDSSIGNYAGIIMKTANAAQGAWTTGYGLYYSEGRVHFYSNVVSSGTVSAALPSGQWTHVMASVTVSDGIRLYINGALAAFRANASATAASSAALGIGGGAGSAAFKGKLDEMAVYSAALSGDDIATLYATSVRSMSGRTVSLDLMRDGNPTPVASIASGLPLFGSYNWTLPMDLVQDVGYRIRATYSDGTNTAVDLSNAPFLVTNNGNSYYVNDQILSFDQFATAVGNDANSGKSPDKPMASIQALLDAYDLDAGDTIYLDAGNYSVPINIGITSNDSGVAIAGAGRTLTNLSRGMTASTGNIHGFEFQGATNVRISRLSVTGAYYGIFGASGYATNGLVVEDAAVFGSSNYGILIQNGANVTVQRALVYGIPGGSTLDNQSYGISLTGANASVLDSEIYDHENTGITLSSDAGVVSRNRVYRNREGMNVQRSGSSTAGLISENEVFNNTSSGVRSGPGYTLLRNRVYGQNAVNSVGVSIASFGAPDLIENEIFQNYDGVDFGFHGSTVRGNRVYANTRWGLNFGAASQMTRNTIYSNSIGLNVNNGSTIGDISNNLFYSNTNYGVTASGLATNGGMLFTGNTIYQDVGDAVRFTSSASSVKMYGNLIWVNSGHAIYVDASSQSGFVSNGNLFHRLAGGLVGFWGGAARMTLGDWQTASGQDSASTTGDPLFVDIDGADNLLGFVGGVDRGRDDNFHLRAGSPAIDRGHGAQNSIDGSGEARADDPVTANTGSPQLKPIVLGTNNFAATGTAQNWRGDESNFTVNFGLTFNFFGSSYTSGVLSTNGRLILGTTWQNQTPNSLDLLTVYPSIAPMWDDLRTDGVAADNIFLNTSVPGQLTIRFNATNKADGSDVNFSFTLFNTGAIEFNYGAGNTNLTPTIGLSGGYGRPLYVLAPYDGMANLTNANTIRFDFVPSNNDVGAFEFLGRSDDATRPTITGSTPTQVHAQGSTGSTTQIVLNLSEPVDALDARSTSIYELRGAGQDNTFGTSDDVIYTVNPQYVSLSTSITLGIVQGSLPNGQYRFTIKGSPAGNSGLHDLAGNVLDGTGSGGGDYTRTFTVVADSVAPTVSGSFVYNAASPRIDLAFSEDIGTSLSTADFVLRNNTTGQIIPSAQLALTYNPTTHVAGIRYLGAANGVLPDGRYTLTLAAGSVTDLAGNPLANPFVLSFVSLGGDANGNGVVDFNDLLVLAQNYGQSNRTFSQGDFNYDGVVDFADLLIMAQRYGSALSNEPLRDAPTSISRKDGRLPAVKGLPLVDEAAQPIIDRLAIRTRK